MESLLSEVIDECTIEAREQGCELRLHIDRAGSVLGDLELLRRALVSHASEVPDAHR